MKQLPRNWVDIRRDWGVLSAYERFESFVAFAFTRLVGIVILVALYRLVVSVFYELLLETLNPLEPAVFQHDEATPASVAALAGLVLSLGGTYWLMRERDDGVRRAPGTLPPGRSPRDREVA